MHSIDSTNTDLKQGFISGIYALMVYWERSLCVDSLSLFISAHLNIFHYSKRVVAQRVTIGLSLIECFHLTTWQPCWDTPNKIILIRRPTWPLRLLSFVSPGIVWKRSIFRTSLETKFYVLRPDIFYCFTDILFRRKHVRERNKNKNNIRHRGSRNLRNHLIHWKSTTKPNRMAHFHTLNS